MELNKLVDAVPRPLGVALAGMGALCVGSALLKAIRVAYKYCLRSKLPLIKRYGAGSWAIVADSCSMIGRATAK